MTRKHLKAGRRRRQRQLTRDKPKKKKKKNGPFSFGYSHVCVSLKGKNDITVLPLHFVFVWDLCGLISFYTSHVPAAAA
jgi:hypothetical protein